MDKVLINLIFFLRLLKYTFSKDEHDENWGTNNYNINGIQIFQNFFYLMCGALGIFVIVFIIIKCCHDNNDQTSNSYNRNQTTTHTNSGQRRIRSYTDRRVPSINALYVHRNDYDGGDINSPLTIITSSENYLDLPPTYIDSTQNSRCPSVQNLDVIDAAVCNEPPSYDQALSNMFATDDNTCTGSDYTGGGGGEGETSNDTGGDCGTTGGNDD